MSSPPSVGDSVLSIPEAFDVLAEVGSGVATGSVGNGVIGGLASVGIGVVGRMVGRGNTVPVGEKV